MVVTILTWKRLYLDSLKVAELWDSGLTTVETTTVDTFNRRLLPGNIRVNRTDENPIIQRTL